MDSKLGLNRSADKRAALAQAVILAMGVVASIDASTAATVIYGGGATLPADAYEGAAKADSTARKQETVKAPSGSLFQVYLNDNPTLAAAVSYCQTGSGTGRAVLDQVDLASGICPDFTATPSGFGAPTSLPDFSASDAPLAQTDVTDVVNIPGATQPVQVPTVAASIAISYNSVSGLSGKPELTDVQLCSIFSGAATDWSQISAGSGPITVVYRSDGSGTTFSFSNHLSKVCSPHAGVYFTTDPLFTNVIAHAGAGGKPPVYAASVSASGNPGVVTLLGNTAGGVGYVETQDALNRTGRALSYFRIKPKGGTAYYDPITNFPGKLTITTVTNKVVSGTSKTGVAVLSTATGTTHGECLIVANPATYSNFTTSYPIVGVSNLLAYYSGNANAAAVSALLQEGPNQPTTTSIGAKKGYAYLTDTAGNITVAIVKSCVN